MNKKTLKKSTKEKKAITIKILAYASSFAENKDVARDLRERRILPALAQDKTIVFDYTGVDSTTQSFTHALLSEAIRKFGPSVLDTMSFKNCNLDVQRIIGIVVEYMQGNMECPIEN